MKKLLSFLLFISSVVAFSQQEISMCNDKKRTFTYSTTSSQSGIYYWYVDGIVQSETSSSMVINWDIYDLGNHQIEVWFEPVIGCVTETVTFFVLTKECENSFLYAPNTFTPDGDAHNNEWKPIGWNWQAIHYIIYNRWGEILFESYDGNVGWNGTYDGRMCPDGVYVYHLKWESASNETHHRYGHINLIR